MSAVPSTPTPEPQDHSPSPHPVTEAATTTRALDQPDEARADVVTEDQVKAALRRVKDPELDLNIIDLGLVYAVRIDGARVSLDMSLTSPGCPSGPEIMTGAEEQVRSLPGVDEVVVNLVWTPFWTPDRIEPRIRAYLGI